MKRIPFLLIYSRIVLAIVIGLLAWAKPINYDIYIVILMAIALITDFFDGYIARRIHIATEKLRIWDSNVDQFFWIVTIISIFYLNNAFVIQHIIWIAIIVVLEIAAYLISYLKFKKTIATHSILAKIWTITLLWFLIDLTLFRTSNVPFFICVGLGIISRLEIVFIIMKLKKWATDIPSILVVNDINDGKEIKKNRLFNS